MDDANITALLIISETINISLTKILPINSRKGYRGGKIKPEPATPVSKYSNPWDKKSLANPMYATESGEKETRLSSRWQITGCRIISITIARRSV